jgi:transketolase
MNIDPNNPDWEDRDWLVLSKGHCGPALYAALALKGYFPMDWLKTVNKPGTRLPSHCDSIKTPGVDITTGSLGQGMSSALGVAMGNRIKGKDNYTYCILGDGELQEGQVWEGVQAGANFNLDHLIVFVDSNKKQLDGRIEDINKAFDMEEKFRSFGWFAQTVPGYDAESICDAIERAKQIAGKPSVIILDTFKGLGVSFAEKVEFNHYMVIDWDMANEAILEIEKRYAAGTFPRGDAKW